ncbi:hypothetical protein BDY24DRAFT_177683 [Mrakia frigida]|uniref:NYN domain-containing protein n=1 Tax=Mrakia frigida TaxID=29902 RepID=UPI003FCBF856
MLKNVSRLTRPLAVPASPSSSIPFSSLPAPSVLDSSSFPSSRPLPTGPREAHEPVPRAGIFWDSENSGCFKPLKALKFLNELRRIAGPLSFIKIYEDRHRLNPSLEELEASGVRVVEFKVAGRKEVADRSFILPFFVGDEEYPLIVSPTDLLTSDMFAFAFEHPEATIVVVSGDSDFSYPLHTLSQRGHRIILVTSRSVILDTSSNVDKTSASTHLLLYSTSAVDVLDLQALSTALDLDLETTEMRLELEAHRQRQIEEYTLRKKKDSKVAFVQGKKMKQAWDTVRSHLTHLEDQQTQLSFTLQKFKTLTTRGRPLPPAFLLRSTSSPPRPPPSNFLKSLMAYPTYP